MSNTRFWLVNQYHEKIDHLLDTYARKLAENMNQGFAIVHFFIYWQVQMTDFSKDKYMKLISTITYFVMSNQGIRRIILYRALFKPTFALKTKVIDSNYGRANTHFSNLG